MMRESFGEYVCIESEQVEMERAVKRARRELMITLSQGDLSRSAADTVSFKPVLSAGMVTRAW